MGASSVGRISRKDLSICRQVNLDIGKTGGPEWRHAEDLIRAVDIGKENTDQIGYGWGDTE